MRCFLSALWPVALLASRCVRVVAASIELYPALICPVAPHAAFQHNLSLPSLERAGAETFQWGPKDIFVLPSWKPIVHEALDGDCVLFSFSDRPVQQKLDLFREDRGNL